MDLNCRGRKRNWPLRWDATKGYLTFCTRTMLPIRRFAERSKKPLENMTNSWPGQEAETKVVWPCLKVFCFSKDNPIGDRRGRHKKRWEDNIKEWTGMEFVSSNGAAENRRRWKGIVANSSVVPRWPSPLMTRSTSILGGKNLCFLEFLPTNTFY